MMMLAVTVNGKVIPGDTKTFTLRWTNDAPVIGG